MVISTSGIPGVSFPQATTDTANSKVNSEQSSIAYMIPTGGAAPRQPHTSVRAQYFVHCMGLDLKNPCILYFSLSAVE